MKIAVCLSGKFTGKNDRGDIQGFEEPYNYLYENIIKNNDVDIYIHGWDDDPEATKKLIELYKPKKHLVEKQIVFEHPHSDYDFKNYQSLPSDTTTQLLLQNIYSRFNSNKKVTDLIEGDYDFVLLTRFDSIFFEPFLFNGLNNEHFYVSNWWANKNGYGFNDAWFMSSKDNIIKFTEIYDNLDNYMDLNSDYYDYLVRYGLNEKNLHSAHCITRFHTEKHINNIHGLGLEHVTWNLLRRINNRRNPWWSPKFDLHKPNPNLSILEKRFRW